MLEYLPNGNFEELFKQSDFTKEQIKIYAYQIVCVLEILHQKGIIHRDIKFENFMLDKNLNLKLIDFGTAKLMDDNKSARALKKAIDEQINLFILEYQKKTNKVIKYDMENQEVGTKYYIPPEYIEYHESGPMWDFWSFGELIRSNVVQNDNTQVPFLWTNEHGRGINSFSRNQAFAGFLIRTSTMRVSISCLVC